MAEEGLAAEQADDGNDLCINNDLNLVLDEDPEVSPKNEEEIVDDAEK